MSSPLTTHVLDTATGRPAAGLHLELHRWTDEVWQSLKAGVTNEDGRVADLLEEGGLNPGRYRMHFDVGAWHKAQGIEGFYPYVDVVFEVREARGHHHVPLLLSPFGYSTYRGS